MPEIFDGLEVPGAFRPRHGAYAFDVDQVLRSVVALQARVPSDAFTAEVLGTERVGNAVVIGPDRVLTIGYLVTEAEEVTLTTRDGRDVSAHVLGVDTDTGFGLLHALEPLDLPALPLGDSRRLKRGAPVIVAGAGGTSHALAAAVTAREPFAGYWEYALDAALFSAPAHPHWSGAALIGEAGELLGIGSLHVEGRDEGGGKKRGEDAETKQQNMFVPIELLPPILDDVASGRLAHEPRPWLGVFCQEIDGHVVVIGTSPNAPARKAELARGDIVHAVAGEVVTDLGDFYRRVWALGPPGVDVPLVLQREGDVFGVTITSADRRKLLKARRLN